MDVVDRTSESIEKIVSEMEIKCGSDPDGLGAASGLEGDPELTGAEEKEEVDEKEP